jgi:hypothetical protein
MIAGLPPPAVDSPARRAMKLSMIDAPPIPPMTIKKRRSFGESFSLRDPVVGSTEEEDDVGRPHP